MFKVMSSKKMQKRPTDEQSQTVYNKTDENLHDKPKDDNTRNTTGDEDAALLNLLPSAFR
jgi:hypothetical protein